MTPSAQPAIEINIKNLSVTSNGQILTTRSRALLVFVCVLVRQKRDNPNASWIGVDGLRSFLPSVHGKQMQRFVDALGEISFPIGYESKTRGRYCLTVPATAVNFDADDEQIEAFIGARENINLKTVNLAVPSRPVPPRPNTTQDKNKGLLDSLSKINQADSLYYDGDLGGNGNAYDIWRKLIETTSNDLKAITLLKFARVCRRLQRFGEAQEALRELRRMLRNGEATNSALHCKAQLCLAMLRYEQGRHEEARTLAMKIRNCICGDDLAQGEYLNLMGLLAGHDLHACQQAALSSGIAPDQDVLPALLEIAAHYYSQALTRMANGNDYHLMQSTCFNLGNLYLSAYREPLLSADRDTLLEQGISWIAQCEFICSKFGVGMDSVWSKIVLLQAALDSGLALSDLNRMTGNLFRNYADLEHLAQATLTEATRIGNLAEQASTLMILAKIAHQKNESNEVELFRQQALAIYRKLNRPDLIRQVKNEFLEKRALL